MFHVVGVSAVRSDEGLARRFHQEIGRATIGALLIESEIPGHHACIFRQSRAALRCPRVNEVTLNIPEVLPQRNYDRLVLR